jgi:predicted O-methyltransferase YrrM
MPQNQRMSEQRWAAVDEYLGGLFGGADPVLDAALAASTGLPAIQVSPLQGQLLHVLARSVGARRVLEIGTLGGYSTIWLGRALPADGRLLTLEAEPRHAAVARANLARAGLADLVEVRVGPAAESLAQLAAAGAEPFDEPFDLVFIDADKPGYPEYLSWALRLTRPGGLIIGDNVVRGGAIADPDSDDPNVAGVRRFLELVAAEPRLTATVLQTVGVKGYDGLAIALVGAG